MTSAIIECWRILAHRWRWLMWGAVLALAGVTVAFLVSPPLYRSDTTVLVRTPGDVTRVQDGGSSYARARIYTYAALVGSERLASAVVADLGLKMDSAVFASRVSTSSPPGSSLLEISVRAPSPDEAHRNATVLLSELSAMVDTLETVPGSRVPRAELVVIDQPGVPQRIVAWGVPAYAVLLSAVLFGLVFGALGAVIRATVATTRAPDAPTLGLGDQLVWTDDVGLAAAAPADAEQDALKLAAESKPMEVEPEMPAVQIADPETAPIVGLIAIAQSEEASAAVTRLAGGRHRRTDEPPSGRRYGRYAIGSRDRSREDT